MTFDPEFFWKQLNNWGSGLRFSAIQVPCEPYSNYREPFSIQEQLITAQNENCRIAGLTPGLFSVYPPQLLNKRSQSGSEPPIRIQDQPVLIDGSGWDEGIVSYHESMAAQLWARQANIIVEPLPVIRIKGCEDPNNRCALNRSEGDPTAQGIGDFLNAAGIHAKHATVFVNSINLANDIGGMAPDFGPYSLLATLSMQYPVGYALAHEWGHSFKLQHTSLLNRNLMNPAENWFLLRGDFITDDQRRAARAAALAYQ